MQDVRDQRHFMSLPTADAAIQKIAGKLGDTTSRALSPVKPGKRDHLFRIAPIFFLAARTFPAQTHAFPPCHHYVQRFSEA